MVEAFNSLLKERNFHTESFTASISMIPKPNTDDTSWSNYIDIKILAKYYPPDLIQLLTPLFIEIKQDLFPQDKLAIIFVELHFWPTQLVHSISLPVSSHWIYERHLIHYHGLIYTQFFITGVSDHIS